MNSSPANDQEVQSESERWASEGEGSPIYSPNASRPSMRGRLNVSRMLSGSLDRSLFLSYFMFIFACVKLTLSVFLIGFRPIGCKFSGSYRCLVLMIIGDIIQMISFGWEIIPVALEIWKVEGDKNFLYQKAKKEELDKTLQLNSKKQNKFVSWLKVGNIAFFWVIFVLGNFEFWGRKNMEFDACEENIQAMMVVLMVFGYCVVFVLLFVFFLILMVLPLILLVTFFANSSQNKREHVLFTPPGCPDLKFYFTRSKALIREWPSKKYSPSDIMGQKICSICMEEYQTDDDLIHLNCHEMHHFHAKCIKKWLVLNVTCPCCRQKMF